MSFTPNEAQVATTEPTAKFAYPKSDEGPTCVVQIIGKLSIGGAERHFVSLINNLDAAKRVAILISTDSGEMTLKDQLDPDVILVHLRIRKRTALLDIVRLARTLKKFGCEVVHTHMFWASLYGSIAAKLVGVPVIVTTEHGENHWKNSVHRWLERNVISRFAGRRFCVSEAIMKRRRDVDGVPEEILQLIANGTAVPANPAELWKHPEPVIGTVGRLVKQKDYELFVRVIGELRQRGHAIRGCIVGEGPELQNIERCIESQKLGEFIELPGADLDIDRWFRYFDIYVVTSREEGLPVSLLEAMSYGLPLVSTDVGAIRTVVRNGVEGVVVESQNIQMFSDAVAELLSHRDMAEEYAANARQRIVGGYSIGAIAAQYQSSYQELLSGTHA